MVSGVSPKMEFQYIMKVSPTQVNLESKVEPKLQLLTPACPKNLLESSRSRQKSSRSRAKSSHGNTKCTAHNGNGNGCVQNSVIFKTSRCLALCPFGSWLTKPFPWSRTLRATCPLSVYCLLNVFHGHAPCTQPVPFGFIAY